MTDAIADYEKLMASDGVKNLDGDAALAPIANLINLSLDLRKEAGAMRAIEWSNEFESRGIAEAYRAVLNYFRSNAWDALRAARQTNDKVMALDQPEIAQQILHLRKALNSPAFDKLPKLYRCQTLTNLGNQLNHVGRFVEALEYWTRALSIDANFWMAQGNRGYALLYYAKAHYDRGHAAALLLSAHQDLTKAIELAPKHSGLGSPDALQAFKKFKTEVAEGIDIKKASKRIKLDGFEIGESEAEKRYRRWCLANRLFLNSLNDLGPHSIAARDIMTLPDFTTKLKEPPSLIWFFSQMKQEFVSARWMYYDGLNGAGPHFSDRDALLHNPLDYPAYGLSVEKVKAAMRTAYSLFDKIAFFLNRYMKLNVPPGEVDFARVWRNKPVSPVRSQFDMAENWPFRGLYWLSKDIRDRDFKGTTEPDARELHEIRNHLEHKYLKIHEMPIDRTPDPESPLAWMKDDLAYSIAQAEFNAKVLRVLKLARAALMYLSLGVNREEKRRNATKKGKIVAAPMLLTAWEDEWKQ